MGDVIPLYPAEGDQHDPEADFEPETLDRIRDAFRRAADSGELDRARHDHPSAHVATTTSLTERRAREHLTGQGMDEAEATHWLDRFGIVAVVPDVDGDDNFDAPIGPA